LVGQEIQWAANFDSVNALNVPGLHQLHESFPDDEANVPVGQEMHTELLDFEYLPASHGMHPFSEETP